MPIWIAISSKDDGVRKRYPFSMGIFRRPPLAAEPNIETIRKSARVLVIDDLDFPHQPTFERDGYHFERWAEIKNLSQLTDGHYPLILLDVFGVGLHESPDKHGLGILEHIKKTNPGQAVILYSAHPQDIASTLIASRADAVLNKGSSYLEYKDQVDRLLLSRATPASFIAAMNSQLGEKAILVPKAVTLATEAFANKDTGRLSEYLHQSIHDPSQVAVILQIIQIGIATIALLNR